MARCLPWRRAPRRDQAGAGTNDLAVRLVPGDAAALAIAVSGRVTMDTSPVLRKALLEALRRQTPQVLAIDLSDVSYMDTSGIATLLEALKAAVRQHVTLRAIGVGGQVKVVAEVFELQRIFSSAGSEVVFR